VTVAAEAAATGQRMGRRMGRRIGRAALPVHAVALGVILIVVMGWIGTGASFSSDESAAIIQARHLAAGQGWLFAGPLPRIDPANEAFFAALSSQGELGTATFAKHALYPVLLAGAYAAGGRSGLVLVSVLGTIAAAWIGARLAATLDPRTERWALWAVGIGSPLFFDSQVVIAHTLGAAAAGGAMLCVLRAKDRRRNADRSGDDPPRAIGRTRDPVLGAGLAGWIAAATVLVGVAVLLRNEAILFGLALGAVMVAQGARRRDVPWIGAGAGIAAASLFGALVDRWITGRIVGAGVLAALPVGEDSFLSSRFSAAVQATVLPGDAWPMVGIVGLMGLLLGIVVAGLTVRLRPEDHVVFRIACGVAVVGSLLPFAGGAPDTIPGLLVACPVLAAAVVVGHRGWLRDEPARTMATVMLVFVAAVLGIQYSQAGAAEWGARFLALGLPMLVPLALFVLARAAGGLDRGSRRVAAAGLVVTTVAVSLLGAWSLRYYHDTNAAFTELVAGAVTGPPGDLGADPGPGSGADLGDGRREPIVVTTWIGLGRLMEREPVEVRGLTVTPDQLPAYLERLRAAGVARITFVTLDPAADLPRLDGLYDVTATVPAGRAAGPVFRLEATR
jgi:hypothetical protein